MKVVCVTGCLGFMSSYFTRACLERGWKVWGIDSVTYAANRAYLDEFRQYDSFRFTEVDIATLDHLYEVEYVFNFAAESHVDNSIMDCSRFIHSNVLGVKNLLELVRGKSNYDMPVFCQISTDEVYGDLESGAHPETASLTPSNPYSASKAAADMLVLGWNRTYGIRYNIIRPTNNYGIGQYTEKLIPKAIKYLSLGRRIPLHAQGTPRRNWLHADDTARAILHIVDHGKRNKIYNVSGQYEAPNIEVVDKIVRAFHGPSAAVEDFIEINYERRGGDMRYSLDDCQLREIGWSNRRSFDEEIVNIVDHYRSNFIW
jgi:dTDP-glucose 4,6-dehydratase